MLSFIVSTIVSFWLYENIIEKYSIKRKNNMNSAFTVCNPLIKKSYTRKLEKAFSKIKTINVIINDSRLKRNLMLGIIVNLLTYQIA